MRAMFRRIYGEGVLYERVYVHVCIYLLPLLQMPYLKSPNLLMQFLKCRSASFKAQHYTVINWFDLFTKLKYFISKDLSKSMEMVRFSLEYNYGIKCIL